MNTWIQQLNPMANAWLEALWRASWQGAIALVLVWAVCSVFKQLPARAKSWLWRLAYLKLLIAFLWSAPIDLPLLSAKVQPAAIEMTQLATVPPIAAPNTPQRIRPPAPTPRAVISTAVPATPATPPVLLPKAAVAPTIRLELSPASWLLSIWTLGVVVFGVCTWRKFRHARRMQGACRPATDPALLQCSAELARCFRLPATPTLLLSETASSPMLLQTLQPVIVLPSNMASSATSQHLQLMLAHEMAHAKRFDLWWMWLAVIGEGLFFFHPLLWLARRQWRLAQEMACDELAVLITRAPVSAYGDMLVGAAGNLTDRREPILVALGLTETKHMLVKRLKAMKLLNPSPAKHIVLITSAILTVGILSLLPWRLIAQTSSNAPPAGATTSGGYYTNAPWDPFGTPPRAVRDLSPAQQEARARSVLSGAPAGAPEAFGGRRGGISGSGRSGSASFGRGMPVSSMAPTTPPTLVAPARFEATIYEVSVSDNHVADLDAAKMESEAGTPGKLAAFLGSFGTVKILYKVDQTVNLYNENITLGTEEPTVSSVNRDYQGNTINNVTYVRVGLATQISATVPADPKSTPTEIQLNFQLSTLTKSAVEIFPGVPVSTIRNATLNQSGTPQYGKPTVLLSVSASGASEKTPPVAYIVRYLFTQPKS